MFVVSERRSVRADVQKLPADTSAAAEKRKQRRAWLETNGGRKIKGLKSYLPDTEGYVIVSSVATRLTKSAGPSKPRIEVASPAAVEGVVLLEAPNDEPLVRELRDMVVGKTTLNEARKA